MQSAADGSLFCHDCSIDTCNCRCPQCRTAECKKHLEKENERCECFCCKSDRRALHHQNRASNPKSGNSVELGSLNKPEKVRFASPHHCGCHQADCSASDPVPTVELGSQKVQGSDSPHESEPWEEVPITTRAAPSTVAREAD